MLTIANKATSAAECELILQATYDDPSPLGLAAVKIKVDSFRPAGNILTRLFMRSAVRNRVRHDIYGQLQGILAADSFLATRVRPEFIPFISSATVENAVNYVTHSLRDSRLPTGGISFSCHLPPCAIVITHMQDRIAESLLAISLGLKNPQALPGYNAQWHCFVLWHELAHGLNQTEFHADRTAALISRCAFQDTTFLHAMADIRALHPVLFYQKQLEHGFDLCLAIDSALSLQEDLTLNTIHQVPAPEPRIKPDILNNCARSLGANIEKAAPAPFKNRDLGLLADFARDLSRTNLNEAECFVANRFAMAAERLTRGARAYHKIAPDLVP